MSDPNPFVSLGNPQPITIDYINWRGELAKRRIMPNRILFGATEWHPEPQWLLEAFDLDKSAMRLFAWRDINRVNEP